MKSRIYLLLIITISLFILFLTLPKSKRENTCQIIIPYNTKLIFWACKSKKLNFVNLSCKYFGKTLDGKLVCIKNYKTENVHIINLTDYIIFKDIALFFTNNKIYLVINNRLISCKKVYDDIIYCKDKDKEIVFNLKGVIYG